MTDRRHIQIYPGHRQLGPVAELGPHPDTFPGYFGPFSGLHMMEIFNILPPEYSTNLGQNMNISIKIETRSIKPVNVSVSGNLSGGPGNV